MTSVLNHHQLSSGNKLFLMLLCLSSIIGCSTTKKVYNQPTPTREVIVEKPTPTVTEAIDTVMWEEISEEDAPPIINETPSAPGLDKKDVYNVNILMPLDASKLASSVSANPDLDDDKFINFYAGAMLAFEKLEAEGINMNVNVYDSKSENIDGILSGYEMRNADLIIGPRDTRELQKVAEFGKERSITVISPWKASSKITSENPYYIQLIPGLYDHYSKIAEHASENFRSENVILLGRNSSDRRRFKYFQQDIPFEEYMVNEDSLMVGETAFDSLFVKTPEKQALIIPNYSSKDERFIYNCLRRINIEKGMKDIVVYGMPIMKDSDRTTFNFYSSLNMHICISKFVDMDESDVINFERGYYNTYAALPTTDAFEGYDVMMYVGRSLDKYGKNFQFHMDSDENEYIQTSYNLEKIFKSEDVDKDNFENINYYGNKHLDIIAFKRDAFKRLME